MLWYHTNTSRIFNETAKAFQIDCETQGSYGTMKEVWLPKSQVQVYKPIGREDIKDERFLAIPEWLARKNQIPANDGHPRIEIEVCGI